MEISELLREYDDVLRPEEVQKILHIGRNTVYEYLKDGRIPSLMIAGKYRIPKGYLLQYLYPQNEVKEELSING